MTAAINRHMHEAEAPLLRELAASGILIDSVWELVSVTTDYEVGVPILLRHLRRSYPYRVKEGIARALTLPNCPAVDANSLLDALKPHETSKEVDVSTSGPDPAVADWMSSHFDAHRESFRWAVANAVAANASRHHFPRICEVLSDEAYGQARGPLALALPAISADATSKKKASTVLCHLLDENDMVIFALKALGKLGVREVSERIQPLLAHPREEVRQEAARTIRTLRSLA